MEGLGRRPAMLIGSIAVVALVAVGIWAFWASIDPSGDPGGQVMAQLTPTATALPGYGTAGLPWVDQIPPSLDAFYIVKMEPHRDSCDGRPGTEGWSQVVVQAGFHWTGGLPSLVDHMDPRLTPLGWVEVPQPPSVYPPTATWAKSLRPGGNGVLSVTEEGGTGSSNWELVATGHPVGRAASGC